MSSVAVSSIVLACVFGGGLFGMMLARLLPEDHLRPESIDLVKLGTGLIATMTAMVLGLLLASAKGSYDTERGELDAVSAKVVLLDRVLAHYGPDSKEARGRLRATIADALDRNWSGERSRLSRSAPAAGSETLYDKIQELAASNDEQRSAKSQALNIMIEIGGTHWLMLEQESNSISMPLLIVVVSWLTVIFISFGMIAPRNATVLATLFICALSVSTAIFLILEMYSPFSGVIRISDIPLRNALVHLGL